MAAKAVCCRVVVMQGILHAIALSLEQHSRPPQTVAGMVFTGGKSGETELERVKGIEPSSRAWEAYVLPLNHTRSLNIELLSKYQTGRQQAIEDLSSRGVRRCPCSGHSLVVRARQSSALMISQWHIWSSGYGGAAENMAADEALLEGAHSLGRPVLRVYGWAVSAATFGYSQRYAEVARFTLLRPLIRRPTGGGLVPHDADWTYCVAIPPDDPWYALTAVESYRRVHDWICRAFVQMGVETELARCSLKGAPGQCFVGAEQFDVLWHGRKIAGAAQRRNRSGLLIQGSVQPPPLRLSRVAWEQAMTDAATREWGVAWSPLKLSEAFRETTRRLCEAKYSRDEFNQQR
jgi:hypothetical protein